MITNPLAEDGAGATQAHIHRPGTSNHAAGDALLRDVISDGSSVKDKKTVGFAARDKGGESTFAGAFASSPRTQSNFPAFSAAKSNSMQCSADASVGADADGDTAASVMRDDDSRSETSGTSRGRGSSKQDFRAELEDIKIKTMYNLVEDVTVDVNDEAVE
jgi:hypothetical protein